jgi:DNA-binding transcriptional ArsR family regulator
MTQVEPFLQTQDDVCEVLYVDEPRVKAVAAQMPADETIQAVVDIFKVLSDPTRIKIIFALSRAELCVCDLAALLGLSVSAVSHQLRLLRSLRLVKYRKEGRLAYYSLDDDHTGHLLHEVLEHVQ